MERNCAPRGFAWLRSFAYLLHPEYGTPWSQRRELFRLVRHAIELPEELNSVRHSARKLSQDVCSLLDWKLHQSHP